MGNRRSCESSLNVLSCMVANYHFPVSVLSKPDSVSTGTGPTWPFVLSGTPWQVGGSNASNRIANQEKHLPSRDWRQNCSILRCGDDKTLLRRGNVEGGARRSHRRSRRTVHGSVFSV